MNESATTDSWLPRACVPGLVSVIIPTFNRAELLTETVRSVFRQTYRPLEVIVADDGSTDDTLQRAGLLQTECPDGAELRISQGAKGGACVARNRGAAESRGEFLMFLDSDDLLTAPAIELMVKRLAETGRDIAWGPWRVMVERETLCELQPAEQRDFGEDWLAILLSGDYIATCSALYRREVLHRIIGWREDLVLDGDYCFNAELGEAGATLAGIDTVTAYYRQGRTDQMSCTSYSQKGRKIRDTMRMIEQALDQHQHWTPARRRALAWRYFVTARMAWTLAKDRDLFVELAHEAERVDPDFSPPNAWYRRLASLVGYRNAERVADMRRKLFR